MKDSEGWNVLTVHTTEPIKGKFRLAFKDDVLRIRKADENGFFRQIELEFDRQNIADNVFEERVFEYEGDLLKDHGEIPDLSPFWKWVMKVANL